MKVIDNPTIELEEKDIETIEKLRELIVDMPCSSLFCNNCPFNSICEHMDFTKPKENTILNIQKALNEALITE